MKKNQIKVDLVVAARPNFVKAAPVYRALKEKNNCDLRLIHTGQHFDFNMSGSFFENLQMPTPHVNLRVAGGNHGEQTGKTMIEFENYLFSRKPDWVLVFGDVNATIACAIAAKKLAIKVAHIEAGLRNFDMSMPEEINRVLTDAISDVHFTTCLESSENLIKEGKNNSMIHFVGNTMIDTLVDSGNLIAKLEDVFLERLSLKKGKYILLTLHRPFNVDQPATLESIVTSLLKLAREKIIVFPAHPRTAGSLGPEKTIKSKFGKRLLILEPLPYLEFISVMKNAHSVFTDSGGVQEETSFLGVPCYTLRPNTERPITVEMGTNRLVSLKEIPSLNLSATAARDNCDIPLWDGKAAIRLSTIFAKLIKFDSP